MSKEPPIDLSIKPPAKNALLGEPRLFLDASSFIALSTTIPSDFFDPASTVPKEERPKTYLDLFKLLPSTAIAEIHIPNVVVQESIGYICFYDNQGKWFSKMVDSAHKRFGEFEERVEFLKNALNNDFVGQPKIVIDCSKKGTSHLQDLLHVFNKYKNMQNSYYVPRVHDMENQHMIENESAQIKRSIDKENLRQTSGKNFGEILCAQAAFDYLGEKNARVIVLTDDVWGLDVVAHNYARCQKLHGGKAPNLTGINSRALLSEFVQNGVAQKAGLRVDLTEIEISQDIRQRINKNHGHPNEKINLSRVRNEGRPFSEILNPSKPALGR